MVCPKCPPPRRTQFSDEGEGYICEVHGWVEAVEMVPADSRGDGGERAKALLAQALANKPIDRKLIVEAYRILAGLPEPEEKT